MSDDIDNYMPYLEEAASKVSVILELGVAKGTGSTLAFYRGLLRAKNQLLISVDHQDYMEWRPPVDWWHLVIGDSRASYTGMLVSLLLKDERYPDIIFIDTHHTYEQMQAELYCWDLSVGPDTTWLFHDTYMMGKYNPMVDAIKEFAAQEGWTYEDVSTDPHGLGRMYR